MEPVDDDSLVRVTWHVPRSTLARLKEQSRLSGAPVAEVVRRALLQEAFPLRALDATEVILPPRVEPGPVPMGVLESIDPKTGEITAKGPVARPAHRWVSVAKDSPVKHCERCHLTERTWRKHGGQPEVCDG